MSSFLSPGVLLHLAGVAAVSQLFLSSDYRKNFYENLNNNATSALHEALDRFAEAAVVFLPIGGQLVGLGTVLQTLVYLAAALYAFYLARLVTVSSSVTCGVCAPASGCMSI